MPKIESTDFTYENGMYGSGEDSILEVRDSDTENEALNNMGSDIQDAGTVYKSLYDNLPSADTNNTTSTDDYFFNNSDSSLTIFGLPLHFSDTADPRGRVFKNTIMRDSGLLYIVPGKTVINRSLITDDGTTISKGTLLSSLENLSDTISPAILAIKGLRKGSDLRFAGFKQDYATYYKYVQLLCNTVYTTMGFSGWFNFGEENKIRNDNHGICFYIGNGTSISESANNSYTEASSVQTTNDKSFEAREYNMVSNTSNESFFKKGIQFLSESFSNFTEAESVADLLTRQGQTFARVVNGSQLLYPQIWAQSNFSKSYNISFRFYSPYGDKESIFKYVYVPFLSILALALPRQDSTVGMGEPFSIRLNAPGWFESSLAVVDSVSFTKGGSDNLWSIDNLPLEMEVSMSIMDLYPAMPVTRKYSHLSYNLGLSSFLDTLAGLRSDQLNFTIGVQRFVKTRLSVPSSFLKYGISNSISDFIGNLQMKINDKLR